MIAIVQRVRKACVRVAGEVVGEIGAGMVVLAAVHVDDTEADVRWMAQKLSTMRIFANGEKYFDLDVKGIGGGILLVSNFTVAAETQSGRRPSLHTAAGPEAALPLFEKLVAAVRGQGVVVRTGRFGAEMLVELENSGPVSFIVDSRGSRKGE